MGQRRPPAGERYLPQVTAAFRAITATTEEIAPTMEGRVFPLGVAPDLMRNGSALARVF